MLHHVSLPVADLHKSAALYDAALSALGYRRVYNDADFAGYGVSEGAVDAFHEAALAHGATDDGGPGLRVH